MLTAKDIVLPHRLAGIEIEPAERIRGTGASARTATDRDPTVLAPANGAGQPSEEKRRIDDERDAVKRALDGIGVATRRLHDRLRALLALVQKASVDLAVDIAEKIVRERIQTGQFAFEALVSDALSQIGSPRSASVRLHPMDKEILERRLKEGGLSLDGEAIHVIGDEKVQRGDCRVDAGDVYVISQWQEQLGAIREQLVRGIRDADIGT